MRNYKKIGTKSTRVDRDKLEELLRMGVPKTRIAKDLGISLSTLHRLLRGIKNG